MFAYKISGDTSTECIECTQEESVALQKQGYFISAEPIVWKNKKFNSGKLEDRPIIKPIYCYSNNGLSPRLVDGNYTPQSGEVLFDHQATTAELSAAFPLYTTIIKQQQIDTLNIEYQQRKERLNARHSSFILSTTDETKIAARTAQLRTEYSAMLAELKTKQEAILND